jgi:hypothetical protein
MNNELNNLKQEAAKLMLSAQEKSAMKARIFGMPSPANVSPKQSPYFIFTYQFMQARVLAPLAVLLVVFLGGSTAAAAQGALPGDALYPIKISFNEAVEVALATTPVAKAEVSAELAVRRVEEAEVLAARGELTPETGEKLASSFETHAENATELAGKVEAEDPAAAASLRTKLDSSLSAHGEILAMLTVGGGEANQEGTGVVAAKVLSRTIASAMPARSPAALRQSSKAAPAPANVEPQTTTMAMSLSITSDTSTSSEAAGTASLENDMVENAPADDGQMQAALGLQKQALGQMAATRAEFDENKKGLPSSAITQVSGELAAIEQLMQLASTTFATAHYAEAQSDYATALRRATKLYVLLGAQANFKQNVITPILENAAEADTGTDGSISPAAN